MTIVVNDILRITCKMKLFGTEDIQNVYTYKVTGGTLDDDTSIMNAIANHMDIAYTLYNARVSTSITYISVDGINITQNTLLPDTPWPILVAGIDAANILPTQVAGCVFWPTTTPKVRTSSFLGGLTEASNDAGGVLTPALVTEMIAFGVFMKGIVAAKISADKGSFNPVSLIFTPSGEPQVPPRWRTQRRRRVGVGS